RPSGADKRVWFNPAAFAINDVGTFGEVGTGAFYGPHIFSWDMGFFKNFRVAEQVNVQFRAEMFNIFNQVNFANPNTSVTGGGFGNHYQHAVLRRRSADHPVRAEGCLLGSAAFKPHPIRASGN
ncbi:MAG: hypothetical protein ACRD96_23705, partial [Bryobacteraceae bacterium]